MKHLFIALIPMLLLSCGENKKTTTTTSDSTTTSVTTSAAHSNITETAKEAYIYGLPLVLMDLTRRQSSLGFAPNTFQHLSSFPDASFRDVVRPNGDTYYSIAWLDLKAEPVVLSVPNTHGRYYMMPMLDAYTNVFASPGTRTTGNGAGNFLVTGPQWTGTVPAGMKEIKAPTNTVWIIGRTQVNSKEDGAKVVVPLQRQYKLTPLSAWGKPYTPPGPTVDPSVPKGNPNTIVKNMSTAEYFNYVNQLLAKYPPPAADKTTIDRFAAIGVGPGNKFDVNALTAADQTAVTDVSKKLLAYWDQPAAPDEKLENGWSIKRKGMGTYGTDYARRAEIAYKGLGANLPEDAIYPITSVDADGKPLNGANKYVIHFDKGKTPPANAFWSITMYSPEGYFVENPINRYTIGDRSHYKTNADGSIDIYLQNLSPGKDKEANWLPAPAGDFNLVLRVYWPKEEMKNGTWQIPPVKKV